MRAYVARWLYEPNGRVWTQNLEAECLEDALRRARWAIQYQAIDMGMIWDAREWELLSIWGVRTAAEERELRPQKAKAQVKH
jgi:hypothetical protein